MKTKKNSVWALARIDGSIYKIGFVCRLAEKHEQHQRTACKASRAYGAMIAEKFGLPVDYQDERLTTIAAERMLIEQAGISRQT